MTLSEAGFLGPALDADSQNPRARGLVPVLSDGAFSALSLDSFGKHIF
jgi:hypothetical protein